MTDPIRRTETTYVDEKTGTARCTVQWLQENLNRHGAVTHPISHNNQLTFFICGEAGFKDIAQQIAAAVDTIDIICWGFDPGIELIRSGDRWPRGGTYGDLLIAAGKRGVQVRLLVWYEPTAKGPFNPLNMPGYTHDTDSWYQGPLKADEISATNSLAMLKAQMAEATSPSKKRKPDFAKDSLLPKTADDIPLSARRQYCSYWYQAAFRHELKGITIRTRRGNSSDIADNLDRATEGQRNVATPSGIEREGMERLGSHHQKPILIDYDYNSGEKAVGYVMGLNSVTDYWDTAEHLLENPLREQGAELETKESIQQVDDAGFRTRKPLRDYACRIEREACGGTGKTLLDRPPMHVFIVMPTPEREQMIPRTYDALATLGQHGGLTKQQEMIDGVNRTPKPPPYVTTAKSMPARSHEVSVVEHANTIEKPDIARLEREYGIKVCTSMLYTCGVDRGRWRYREIYIHSKLMIVDDLFMTLGSANLNHRSMAVDSEINISLLDPVHSKELRKKIWYQLTGGSASGGEGNKSDILDAFKKWVDLLKSNKSRVLAETQDKDSRELIGHILQLEDNRSSIIRLG